MNSNQLFFSIGLLFIAISASSQVASKKPANSAKPIATAAKTKIYKNDSLRISVSYPSELAMVDNSKNNEGVLNVSFGKNIKLSNVKFLDSGPEYSQLIDESLRKSLPEYDTTYKKYADFGKNRLYDFVCSFVYKSEKAFVRMIQLEASPGNITGCYVMEITCMAAEYDKYKKLGESMAASLKELPAHTTSFVNQKLKLSFLYPTDWSVQKNSEHTTFNFSRSSITIWEADGFFGGYNATATLKEIAEKEIKYYSEKNNLKKDYILLGQEEFNTKGKQMYKLHDMYLNPSNKLYMSDTYIGTYSQNGVSKPFKIEFAYPSDQYKKYGPYFDQFIKTVNFTK